MKYIINKMRGEGGSAEFYTIKGHKNLGFKQFRNKASAIYAYKKQKLLSQLDLAPKVYGKVCKLAIGNKFYSASTNWGYITEYAKKFPKKDSYTKLKELQKLVEDIHAKTRLKFWDCHPFNLGYIVRNNKTKLVCIDTGRESFKRENNAWGSRNPGPQCYSCKNFNCNCEY